jgi:hypothetical protein
VDPPITGCTGDLDCAAANDKCVTYKCDTGFTPAKCVVDTTKTEKCDDGNACTGTECDPAIGCTFKPVVCDQNNKCYNSYCINDPADTTKPLCVLNTTAKVCDDHDYCTTNFCDNDASGDGCVYPSIACPGSNITCSYPGNCQGKEADGKTSAECGIVVYPCFSPVPPGGLPPGAVAGIAAGVIAGIVVAAVVAALLAAFLSKKGYDYYQAQSALQSTGAQSNPAYTQNQAEGRMPDAADGRQALF